MPDSHHRVKLNQAELYSTGLDSLRIHHSSWNCAVKDNEKIRYSSQHSTFRPCSRPCSVKQSVRQQAGASMILCRCAGPSKIPISKQGLSKWITYVSKSGTNEKRKNVSILLIPACRQKFKQEAPVSRLIQNSGQMKQMLNYRTVLLAQTGTCSGIPPMALRSTPHLSLALSISASMTLSPQWPYVHTPTRNHGLQSTFAVS